VAAAVVGGMAAWLISMGLPPLPSSVMVKGSDVAGADGVAGKILAFIDNFTQNVSEQAGLVFLVLGVMLVFAARSWLLPRAKAGTDVRQDRRAGSVALFVAVILIGHLFAGRFGWAQRYEAYGFVTALVALPVVFRQRALAFLQGRDGALVTVTMLILLLAFAPNVRATLESPEGSRNIFVQQRQMHRLAVEYVKAPVAVNDLGWVSYGNPAYVLDLWGLGSERARAARTAGQGTQWMDELARQHGVQLVMIYEAWLPEQPENWVRLGHMTFRGKLVTAAERDVAFFATGPEQVSRLNTAIESWSEGLPNRAKFFPDIHENPAYQAD
jgi:hypothetical protein